MMSFQKFTTLAALVLYAWNAALAAPVPQLPVPVVTQPLNIVDGVVGTAGSLVGGSVSSVTPVLSDVPITGNVVRHEGLPSLDLLVPSGLPSVINEIVIPTVKGVVRRDSLLAIPASLPTLPVVSDLNRMGAMNLSAAVGSLLSSVVPGVENII